MQKEGIPHLHIAIRPATLLNMEYSSYFIRHAYGQRMSVRHVCVEMTEEAHDLLTIWLTYFGDTEKSPALETQTGSSPILLSICHDDVVEEVFLGGVY
jgi:hypothetical protein